MPCDSLWLDIEYMDGYRVFTWNAERFPDPSAMLGTLAEQGFRVITIIDPGVKFDPGYAVFDAGLERDVFCRTEGGDIYLGQVWPGNTAFPDFVTEEGRTWWGELNAAHVQSGLAGIWNDMNEPATGNIPSATMRFGRGAYSHERFHNQYALLMAMATTAGLRKQMPDLRTFVLSRAGFAGIQRYAANWMGDNLSRWDHLWVSMPMGAGLGLSGQAFVGADIGGFAGNTNPELFLRWMQYGVLTPFCRNHSELGNVDQYAWSFGDVIGEHVRAAVKLRYRLLPYLYACFLTAAETGAPVQRPLVFDYQYDGVVRDIDDEYLLGPDLLVAPVTAPGITARQVYLPAGDWYDWHTGERVGGQRFVTAATPMERIPLYARGGAVIPMWAEAPASTMGFAPEAVELHLFVPSADGTTTSMLQEDDGLTFAALSGARYRTELTVARAGHTVLLQATVTGDGYPEFARERFVLVLHGAAPDDVRVDGTAVSGQRRAVLLRQRRHRLHRRVHGMTYVVRAARPEEYAEVGALTAEAYRADGLLDAHDRPVDAATRRSCATPPGERARPSCGWRWTTTARYSARSPGAPSARRGGSWPWPSTRRSSGCCRSLRPAVGAASPARWSRPAWPGPARTG